MKPLKLFFILFLVLLVAVNTNNAQWKKTGEIPYGKIRCLTFKDTSIFAGTYGGGIYRSIDNGLTWDSVNAGLKNKYIKSLTVNGQNLFAGSDGGGVFKSINNGAKWDSVNSGHP